MARWYWLIYLILTLGLSYIYLYPGGQALLEGRTDTVMSDGTDPAPMPTGYANMIRTWHEHPSRLFYGAVYYDGLDVERGVESWYPWIERWPVIALSPFVVPEQLSTGLVFVLLLLDAWAMYALARAFGWNRSISSGLGWAWAFCAYNRARAKVHMAFAGTFHLPLIFLGLYLVVHKTSRRSLTGAALCFLGACTVAHYYLVTCLFLSPFFVGFALIQPESREHWKRVISRLTLSLLPALCFLAWNAKFPVPSDAKVTSEQAYPTNGVTADGKIHPFLFYFAAQPIDYLGGDFSLQHSASDSNILRQWINQYILDHLASSNTHERTNGIRWSLLLLALLAWVALLRGRFKEDAKTQMNLIFFLAFGLFTFWLSLSPATPWGDWGPSAWLQSLISQVRVPSRAGINVHFSVLMASGFLLGSSFKFRRYLQYPGVFPALMIASYPPLLQEMPMATILPPVASLQLEHGHCGTGLYFPFINMQTAEIVYYEIQRLRGTDCFALNVSTSIRRAQPLIQAFPPTADFMNHLPFDSVSLDRLKRLATCVPLSWILFDPGVPAGWVENACHQLGWTLNPDRSCISPEKGAPLRKYPDEC